MNEPLTETQEEVLRAEAEAEEQMRMLEDGMIFGGLYDNPSDRQDR